MMLFFSPRLFHLLVWCHNRDMLVISIEFVVTFCPAIIILVVIVSYQGDIDGSFYINLKRLLYPLLRAYKLYVP
jgi:hypothetical protein